MMETLLETIRDQTGINETEAKKLEQLIPLVIEEIRKLDITVTPERWIPLGAHLVAFMNRVEKQEFLPPVEQSILDQVNPKILAVSMQILDSYSRQFGRTVDDTEALLLAVHFEAARSSN